MKNVGQFTCLYQDRNFLEDECKKEGFGFGNLKKVPWCITSAALLNVEAWKKPENLMRVFLLIRLITTCALR